MSLVLIGFRTLFAAAILAQLAAPVLAANARALNLFCPSHLSQSQEATVHHPHSNVEFADGHAGHSNYSINLNHVDADTRFYPSVVSNENNSEQKSLFDLSCCSVHVTAVMPLLIVSNIGKPVKLYCIFVGDPALSSVRDIDPPPRGIV